MSYRNGHRRQGRVRGEFSFGAHEVRAEKGGQVSWGSWRLRWRFVERRIVVELKERWNRKLVGMLLAWITAAVPSYGDLSMVGVVCMDGTAYRPLFVRLQNREPQGTLARRSLFSPAKNNSRYYLTLSPFLSSLFGL